MSASVKSSRLFFRAICRCQDHLEGSVPSADCACRRCWGTWLGMLLLQLLTFSGVTLYVLASGQEPGMEKAEHWFLAMMGALAAGIPLIYYLRGRFFFRDYWSGHHVKPPRYFLGNVMVWAFLTCVTLLSLLGCGLTREFAPTLIPALMAFVLFLTQWPNGSAMIETGSYDDASQFDYPR